MMFPAPPGAGLEALNHVPLGPFVRRAWSMLNFLGGEYADKSFE